jgi:hypothetical protein
VVSATLQYVSEKGREGSEARKEEIKSERRKEKEK